MAPLAVAADALARHLIGVMGAGGERPQGFQTVNCAANAP